MGIEALLSTQIIDTTTVGRAVMTAVDAAAARTALGLGTLATQNGTITDYLTTAAAATTYQPLDGDLTALAALSGTNNIYYRSAANTWSSVTIGTGLTFTGGTLAASSAGIGGSTGSTDNLILRADGTGGATLQNSDWSIPDVFTASPNATVNHLSLQATGTTTNVSVSIVPKGTGAFSLQVPDGASSGGNARGASAVDLQTLRTSASQVASGTGSVIAGGRNNTVTTDYGFASGSGSTVSGSGAAGAIGTSNVVSGGLGAGVFGAYSSVTSDYGFASGFFALSNSGERVHARDSFAGLGGQQIVDTVLRASTTGTTTATMDFRARTGHVHTYFAQVCGVRNGGGAVVVYTRRITVKNVAGTLTVVENQTIGTDYEDSAGADLTVGTSGANLRFTVLGISGETWRWCAVLYGMDHQFG